MSILSCGLSRDERGGAAPRGTVSDLPLAVPPKDAWRLLGCSNSTGYELLAAGELDSFRLGRARRITVDSIRQLIARRLAAAKAEAAASVASSQEAS